MSEDFLWWSTAEWQALGTIVLVVVTGVYVVFTWKLAGHADRSAASAETSAEAAERAASAAERGVLLRVMPLVFGHQARMTGGGRCEVSLLSVNDVAAFNVVVVVRQDGQEGDAGPLSFLDPSHPPPPIDLKPGFAISTGSQHEVVVSYYDALGNGYRTRRSSLVGTQSLSRVERWDETTKEWIPLV